MTRAIHSCHFQSNRHEARKKCLLLFLSININFINGGFTHLYMTVLDHLLEVRP